MAIIEVIKNASQYVDDCRTTDNARSITVYIGGFTDGFCVYWDGRKTGSLSLYRYFLQQALEGLILHFVIKQTVSGDGFWIEFEFGGKQYEEWFEADINESHKFDAIKYILKTILFNMEIKRGRK